jgi:hypothetical protein
MTGETTFARRIVKVDQTTVVTLPDGLEMGTFVPVAYYDKNLDCIRVLTHDRSVTELRVNGTFTVFKCNDRGSFDPEYVGFAMKGIRHLFSEVGLPLDGVYRLAEIIARIVKNKPSSSLAVLLELIYKDYQATGDLEVNMKAA